MHLGWLYFVCYFVFYISQLFLTAVSHYLRLVFHRLTDISFCQNRTILFILNYPMNRRPDENCAENWYCYDYLPQGIDFKTVFLLICQKALGCTLSFSILRKVWLYFENASVTSQSKLCFSRDATTRCFDRLARKYQLWLRQEARTKHFIRRVLKNCQSTSALMDLNVVWTFKNLKIRNEKHHKEKVTLFKQNWTNVNVCRRSFLCKFLWATKHA